MIIFCSKGAHFLNTYKDKPACNMPGVAKTTIGPGLSTYDRSKGYQKIKPR